MRKPAKSTINITNVNVGDIGFVTDGEFSVLRTDKQFVLVRGSEIRGPFPIKMARIIRLVFELPTDLSKEEWLEIEKMLTKGQIVEVEKQLKNKKQ